MATTPNWQQVSWDAARGTVDPMTITLTLYLTDWRNLLGLSIHNLATGVGVDPSTISRLENGHRGASSSLRGAIEGFLLQKTASLTTRHHNRPRSEKTDKQHR